jgi:phage-related protein
MEGLKVGVENKKDAPTESMEDTNKDMQHVFHDIKEWSAIGSNMLSRGLKEGILAKKTSIVSVVSHLELDMEREFTKNERNWTKFGSDIVENLTKSINSNKSKLLNSVKTLLQTLQTNLSTSDKKIESETQRTWTSVQNKFNTGSTALKNICSQLVNEIYATFKRYDWNSVGQDMINRIHSGFSSGRGSITSTARSIANEIENAFNNHDWAEIGRNITRGIHRGIQNNWSWLTNTARKLANDVYNTARNALQIHSPSRKFAWLGSMISEGLGNGIEQSSDTALDAIKNVTDEMTDLAQEVTPTIELNTQFGSMLDKFDDAFTKFSDKFIGRFDMLVEKLEQLSNYQIPDIAVGKVVPVASGLSATKSGDIQKLLDLINRLRDNIITRDELYAVLSELLGRYCNTSLYIGDEQIARHANAGNVKLAQRFGT